MKQLMRVTATLFSLLFLLGALSAGIVGFAEGEEVKGDVDRDGVVTTDDAALVLEMASGIRAGEVEKADMDADNVITAKDARLILYAAAGIVLPEKTGDNLISDDPNNQYIAFIAAKYRVDAKLLVAIYAVPDTGNNFVLQFDGTKDAAGKVVRSPDTLKKVYRVDAERNVSVATGKMIGNEGCTYAESYLIMRMVKEMIMPQHPDYFTGVENMDELDA